LRDRVHSCIEIYTLILGRTDAEIRAVVPPFEQAIRLHAPDLATELDAIAEGAGVDRHWIYALNARSELARISISECTAMLAPGSGVLGQTWDWLRALEDLFVFVHIERPDGHRILSLVEPGMVAKIGCNTAGVGVCLNFLDAPQPIHGGVPVHVRLRMILDSPDLDSARAAAEGPGAGASGNILVGSVGRGFDVEYDGIEHRIADLEHRTTGTNAFAHTNHHLQFDHAPDTARGDADNSCARLRRVTELAATQLVQGSEATVADVQRLLGDQADPTYPICRPYVPKFGVDIGTLCTIVMGLGAGELHYRVGPDPAGAWTTLQV
jgi:isopenicillin-N N-acyltransferase-like protein